MSTVIWAIVIGLLVLQIVLTLVAWRHLARRTRLVVSAWQRAASSDVPTSMLVTGMSGIEARLHKLESTHAQAAPAPAPSGEPAYQLAQRMAHDGVDAARIAESCGIALREAELLANLHGPARMGAAQRGVDAFDEPG